MNSKHILVHFIADTTNNKQLLFNPAMRFGLENQVWVSLMKFRDALGAQLAELRRKWFTTTWEYVLSPQYCPLKVPYYLAQECSSCMPRDPCLSHQLSLSCHSFTESKASASTTKTCFGHATNLIACIP